MRNSLVNSSPSINNFEYSWSNIIIMFNGAPFTNITAIDYKESTIYENLYGKGSTPTARGAGNHSFEGSITIRLSEILALQDAARLQGFSTGDLTSLPPFNVIVSFVPSSLGEGSPVTDTLLDCQFGENMRGMAQGDLSVDVALPLVIGGIVWGEL